MTALIRERMPTIERWAYRTFPLAAGSKAYKGAIAAIDLSTGKVEPGHAEIDLFCIGRFAETVDATAVEKPVNVQLAREIEIEWQANSSSNPVAANHVGSLCYIEDDQTVGMSRSGSVAGRVWAVDATSGVAVEMLQPAAESPPGPFPGFDRSVNIVNPATPVTIAATSGTAQIPGPGAGFLRVITGIILVSQGATPSVAIVLNPHGYSLGRALAPATGGVSLVPPFISVSNGPMILGAGETLDFANTGTGACTLWYAYYDLPAAGRTLVRAQVAGATPVELIPAAAAGFRNRLLTALGVGGPSPILRAPMIEFNDDTANAVISLFVGGVLFARSASTAAGSAFSPVGGHHELTVTSGALSIALGGAVTTRNVIVVGCYETLANP